MGELVVVTGPPGAGKSAVSEELANRWQPSALVAGDVFFGMIKQGYILPWLPQARHQNAVIIEAAAAAAGRLCGICSVVYDGVLGPWFLPTFVRASGLGQPALRCLVASAGVCLERVRSRVGHGFTDLSVTRDMYQQFADARIDDRHMITDPDAEPTRLAELINGQLGDGVFDYSSS